ncbi:mCG145601, partial [Mus musculus]
AYSSANLQLQGGICSYVCLYYCLCEYTRVCALPHSCEKPRTFRHILALSSVRPKDPTAHQLCALLFPAKPSYWALKNVFGP